MRTYVMKMAGVCEIVMLRYMWEIYSRKHTYMARSRGKIVPLMMTV